MFDRILDNVMKGRGPHADSSVLDWILWLGAFLFICYMAVDALRRMS